jgi:hypothetical protein
MPNLSRRAIWWTGSGKDKAQDVTKRQLIGVFWMASWTGGTGHSESDQFSIDGSDAERGIAEVYGRLDTFEEKKVALNRWAERLAASLSTKGQGCALGNQDRADHEAGRIAAHGSLTSSRPS